MKLYAITIVKNEADIIAYTLKKASEWADKIIVLDNGSTDGTWEIVKELSDKQIVAFKQDFGPYSDGMRSQVFHAFKHELTNEDWWVIQDSDEIYQESPKDFIFTNQGYCHHINGKKIDFLPSKEVFENSDAIHIGSFEKDFTLYSGNAWSEPRIMKNRYGMKWTKIWPDFLGVRCNETIHISHFPLRSKRQEQMRKSIRKESIERGGQVFGHWVQENTRNFDMIDSRTDQRDPFRVSVIRNKLNKQFIKKILYRILFGFKIVR